MRTAPFHPSPIVFHLSHRRSRAFTFAEVMFAVVILGIGFIMVAAMFPVAIRQTQSTLQDIGAVAEARRGEATIRQLGVAMAGYYDSYQNFGAITNAAVPAFANVVVQAQQPYGSVNAAVAAPLHSFYGRATPYPNSQAPIANFFGDMINQYDHRIAWVPIAYQCDMQARDRNGDASCVDANGQPVWDNATNQAAKDANNQTRTPVARSLPQLARVWLVAVQKRDPDSTEYNTADIMPAGFNAKTATVINNQPATRYDYLANLSGTLIPKRVYVKLVEGQDPSIFGASYPDTLVFTDQNGTPVDEPAADIGAYVWIADDQITTPILANTSTKQYAYAPGAANGRFYRLGSKVDALVGVWELQAGADLQIVKNPGRDGIYDNADDGIATLENLPPRPYDATNHPYATQNYANISGPQGNAPAVGFMIGKGLKNPALPYSTSNPYVGTAQDLFALPPVTVYLKQ